MIKQRVDSRDKHYHKKYGSISQFPDEFIVTEKIPDYVQAPGNVECTAITCCDIAGDKDGVTYDINELFGRVPHDMNGANPRDALSEAVKGLVPTGQLTEVKVFSSYWRADTGSMDAFDNFRSALFLAKIPVALWTNWYQEWFVGASGIMPIGTTKISGHMFDAKGWKQVNGEPMLIVCPWLGYEMYMPRATFNSEMAKWGNGSAVLSTDEIDAIEKKTLTQIAIDLIKNIILFLQNLLRTQVTPVAPIVTPTVVKPVTPTITPSNKLYDLSYSLLEKHLTLDNTVPYQEGCAEAVSYVLDKYGCPIPTLGLASTNALENWLSLHCTEVTTPIAGDIIISVSYTGKQGMRGHTGIVGKHSIMSNNSDNGLWECKLTMPTWLAHYRDDYQLRTRYFRVS